MNDTRRRTQTLNFNQVMDLNFINVHMQKIGQMPVELAQIGFRIIIYLFNAHLVNRRT